MKDFYEYLQSKNIIYPPDVEGELLKLKPDEIISFAVECYVKTEASARKLGGVFNFAASSTMSGGVRPCSDMNCRVKNVYDLSAFAALYADTVFILNPFEHIYHRMQSDFKFDHPDQFIFFLQRLVGDVVVMLNLKPLFQSGMMAINHQLNTYCQSCWSRSIREQKKVWAAFEKIKDAAMQDVNKHIRFIMDTPQSMSIEGPKEYMGQEAFRFAILPKHLAKYSKKAPYTFKEKEVDELGFWELVILPVFEDLFVQKYFMKYQNAAYLTDKKIEASIIKYLNKNVIAHNTEQSAINELTHELPFLEAASLDTLVTVRSKEPEAFAVYRDKIIKALRESSESKNHKIVKELVENEIKPQLRKIDQIIKSHKNEFTERGKRKVAWSGLVLSAGIFANQMAGIDLLHVLELGGINLGEIYKDFSEARKIPSTAKNSDYYFLWNIRSATPSV
jgi:hypothetical protein